MKIQKVSETVEQYANDVKKLIRRIDGENRWSEDEKVWQFLKGLRKDIAYQARPLILSQENPSLEAAIRIAKQFEENAQTYPEATVGYGATTYMNPQGFTPNRGQDNNREDVIERIVQKALAPIVEKLQKITERDERPAHTSYRRPSYNNDIRGQNTWNRNNNANDPFRCFFCGQSGHIARVCPTKQGNFGNPAVPPSREPARTVQPQTNVATNQSVNQIPINGVSGRTFVTQQEEVKQPAATTWETTQHLNY
jgi:hypothetical protein